MRTLTREHRALLSLVRITPTPVGPVPPLGDLDWQRLAALAVQHNLAPLLLERLRDRSGLSPFSAAPPADVLRALEQDFYFCLALSRVLHAAFEELIEVTTAAKLRMVPLKGILFSSSLYPSPELRPMVDIDVLVKPAEMRGLGALLEQKGYARSAPAVRPVTQEEMFEHRYVRGSGPYKVLIELHRGLGQPGRYRVDYDALWRRTVPAGVYGVRGWGEAVAAMSAEDNLLHLCLHQSNHVFDETDLRSVLDLHELIMQWTPDWEVVLPRAREWGVLTALHLALGTVRRLMGTPIPDRVIEDSRPGPLRGAWLSVWIDAEGLGMYRYGRHPSWLKRLLVGFALMDRMSDRIRYGLEYASLRLRDALSRGSARAPAPRPPS